MALDVRRIMQEIRKLEQNVFLGVFISIKIKNTGRNADSLEPVLAEPVKDNAWLTRMQSYMCRDELRLARV